MTVRELRALFLRFFKERGHVVVPSGSLIPYDVTGALDESLLFNGAGMVQFKPYFRGTATPPNKRLANVQKCLRNGDIESVGNPGHLTFFEMLGNFSFGDYFKEDAIRFSWQFLTESEWLGLDPSRLAFTVFDTDEESHALWSEHMPERRIFRLGEKTNYWPAGAFSNGPPGPCGPNSEVFYWTLADGSPPGDDYTAEQFERDADAGKWLEIWNDVFIQYEWEGEQQADGYKKMGMPELPFRSVDTGMGLERTAATLGGSASVYETDALLPVVRAVEAATQTDYQQGGEAARAIRIIADHIRAAGFSIADGILPSNTGRGYVIRRLIRRAAVEARQALGHGDPIFGKVFEGVIEAVGDAYPELDQSRARIIDTLTTEEEQFQRNLDSNLRHLQDEIERSNGEMSGDRAFFLYETYGFPLEVIREAAGKRGVVLDETGFAEAMTQAQEASRAGSSATAVYSDNEGFKGLSTTYVGEHEPNTEARILKIDGTTLVVDRTPFYAESGGQVGDTGTVQIAGKRRKVLDTQRASGVVAHQLGGVVEARAGDAVTLEVDWQRRQAIRRNHTATHLLHAALRQALGEHVAQAGSVVAPDHLRFDFSHGHQVLAEQLQEVEALVNAQVIAALPVCIEEDVEIEYARNEGAMMLFGQKYGDRVRTVKIEGISYELCGGSHVANTGEIGPFLVIAESSAAAGVRRIRAITGRTALEHIRNTRDTLAQASDLLKSKPEDLVESIQRQAEALKQAQLAKRAAPIADAQVEFIGDVEFATQIIEGGDKGSAQALADELAADNPARVALVAASGTIVCKVGSAAQAHGVHAGELIKATAEEMGARGGGNAAFATAGGGDPARAEQAFQKAKSIVRAK